jgi:hypothetical protein
LWGGCKVHGLRDLVVTLLDQSHWMRQAESLGCLDIHETRAVVEQVEIPFKINCCRLAFYAVKECHSLDGVISKVYSEINSLLVEARQNMGAEADLADFEYLKNAIEPVIKVQWDRPPFQKFLLGHLDMRPRLVIIPTMVIFIAFILLARKLGWIE